MTQFIENMVLFILGIILPVKIYLLIVGLIICIDTYYGLKAAKTSNTVFSFKKLFDGLIKKFTRYSIFVLAVYWVDTTFFNDLIVEYKPVLDHIITKLWTMILLAREVVSINDNYKVVHGHSFGDNIKTLVGFGKKAKDIYDDFNKNDE